MTRPIRPLFAAAVLVALVAPAITNAQGPLPCPPDIQECETYGNHNLEYGYGYALALDAYLQAQDATLQSYAAYASGSYAPEQAAHLADNVAQLSVWSGQVGAYAGGPLLAYVLAAPAGPAGYANAVAAYGVGAAGSAVAFVESLAGTSTSYSGALAEWIRVYDESDGNVIPPVPVYDTSQLSLGSVPTPESLEQVLPPPPQPPGPPAPAVPGSPASPPSPDALPVPDWMAVAKPASDSAGALAALAGAGVDLLSQSVAVSATSVASDGWQSQVPPSSCPPYWVARNEQSQTVDTDGDGLSDYAESHVGLDWCQGDDDGDGIPDGRDLIPNVPATDGVTSIVPIHVYIKGYHQGVAMDDAACGWCDQQVAWGDPYIINGASVSGLPNPGQIFFPYFKYGAKYDHTWDRQDYSFTWDQTEASGPEGRGILDAPADIAKWHPDAGGPFVSVSIGLGEEDGMCDDVFPAPAGTGKVGGPFGCSSPITSVPSGPGFVASAVPYLVDIAKASVQDARELVASPLSWAGSDGHTAIQMTLGFKVDGVNPCFVALASDWSQRQMNGQGIVPTPPSLCGI